MRDGAAQMTDPARGKAAARENRNANCSCKKHMPDRAVLVKQLTATVVCTAVAALVSYPVI